MKKQSGFTLLEILVALGLMSSIYVGVVKLTDLYFEDTKNVMVAQHTRMVASAMQEYVKDNHAALLAATAGGVQQNITVPMLQTTRFLPADFRETNAYGQQITSVVRRSPVNPNRVEALLVTQGGEALNDVTLGNLASVMGASGGAIYRTNPAVVQGSGGAWSVPAADFSHGVTLEEGHLAYSLWLEGGGNSSGTNEGVLHRDAVPGHPDLNTMNTPILMSAGTVRIVGDVCSPAGALSRTNTGRLLFCDGTTNRWKTQGSFFWEDPVVGGFADLPPCTNNGQTRVVMNPTVGSGARVYTCNTSVPEWQPLAVNDQGNLVVAGRVTANSVEAQNVKATTMTADKLSGELQVTPTAADGTACTGEGRLARSSVTSGLILSCQSGVWKTTAPQGITDICLVDSGGSYGDNWCRAYCRGNAPGVWKAVGAWDVDRSGGVGSMSVASGFGLQGGFNGYNWFTTLCVKIN